MKKWFYLLMCAVFLAAACTGGTDEPIDPNDPENPENPGNSGNPDEPEDPNVVLEISTSELFFEQEGGTQDFTVTCNGAWKVSSSEEWCKTNYPAGSGNLTVSVTAEVYDVFLGDVREAVVTLQSGKKKRELKVKQKPAKAVHVVQDTIRLSADGGRISVEVQNNYDSVEYVVSFPWNQVWISQVQESKAIISKTYDFMIAKNGFKERVGYIVFSANSLIDTVYIVQEGRKASIGDGNIYGDAYTESVSGVSFDMVYIEGGTFSMGATAEQGSDAYDDEKPVHQVTLSDYYIGKYEVTQGLWKAVTGSNPSRFQSGDNYPVEMVSWDEVQDFLTKLNALTGKHYVLPTEAQWEYAARGGVKSQGYKYSGSNEIDDVAWHSGNSGDKTHPVGLKSPNELGIYDMSGNVWEWCGDWLGYYSSSSQTNPIGPVNGFRRVYRGGSWYPDARLCRVSYRACITPDYRSDDIGFRVVLLP